MSVHVRDLEVTHGGQVLVDVTDVALHAGRPLTIVGESGSGKSLLAHAVMGTLPAGLSARGTLEIDGRVHDAARPADRRLLWGSRFALLPQEPMLALDPTMRVGAQVAEGAWARGASGPDVRRRVRRLLSDVGLDGEWGAYPHTLSGGMAQRVAFAAATVGGAGVLIADEPSKGLDVAARASLARLLRRHVDGGGLLLTITHDLDLARELGGDVLVMREATVLERGPVEQVLSLPRHDYTRRLLAAEPRRWPARRAGRAAGHVAGHGAAVSGDPLVVGTGLAKSYGGKRLFQDLDVEIRAGQRVALTGPSGSGKTTLGGVLLRLVEPDAGRVLHSPALAGGRLQKLYQDPTLAFPALVPLRVSMGDVLRRHRRERQRLDELMAALRLPTALLDRRPGQVSGGELQRIAVLRAMLLDPLLLFADEPTSRLDLITQQETIDALTAQLERRDCALVLVTHDGSLAEALTDTRVSLEQGSEVASAVA